MNKILFAGFLFLTLISSCSKNYNDGETNLENKAFLSVSSAPASDTRSVIAGNHLDETHWSEKDLIQLFYKPAASADALQSAIFTPYRLSGTDAVFTSDMAAMAPGSYDYYAVFPEPQSVSGSIAGFTVDPIQNGSYGPAPRMAATNEGYDKDIMVAYPVTADAVTTTGISMRFVHKTHVFRIQVPEGRNRLGKDIKKLTVSFPTGVAGNLAVDLSDPNAQPVLGNPVSTVTLDLERYLNESVEDDRNGNYVWLFVAPVRISGKVSFYMSTADGLRAEVLSVNMDKQLEAGRITPVTVTIPTEMRKSGFNLTLGGNHLGEAVRKVTVKAPQGAQFVNGLDSLTFDVTSALTSYPIEFYENCDGMDNGALFRNGRCTVIYESEHAIVRNDFDASVYRSGQMVDVVKDVPYLLFEDFSGVTTLTHDSYTDNQEDMTSYNLPGWTGMRIESKAGTSIKLRTYLGSSAMVQNPDSGDNARARADSPFLTGLKPGATVNINVKYRISGTKKAGTLSRPTTMFSTCEFGVDTRPGIIQYSQTIERPVADDQYLTEDGTFERVNSEKEYSVTGCTSRNRLSWRAAYRIVYNNKWSVITAGHVFVYIDDVRVSIAN